MEDPKTFLAGVVVGAVATYVVNRKEQVVSKVIDTYVDTKHNLRDLWNKYQPKTQESQTEQHETVTKFPVECTENHDGTWTVHYGYDDENTGYLRNFPSKPDQEILNKYHGVEPRTKPYSTFTVVRTEPAEHTESLRNNDHFMLLLGKYAGPEGNFDNSVPDLMTLSVPVKLIVIENDDMEEWTLRCSS